ncbi:MAG: gamma-glutamyl-gamma-aminobutyrate hydrolase family protein [Actinomycetota bacterium]|nr:gamma-glutamyl-gamma-aminobutyrate hydrolase family protein [Actinomycetota bacterium]
MKPLVAVTMWKRALPTFWDPRTPLFSLAEHYVEALRRAGAVPLLLAHPDPDDVAQILDVVHGVVLTGGGDIDPPSYAATNDGLSRDTNPAADATEIAVVAGARQRRLPTLGICRGMQLLNVALGGTMRQHVTTPQGPHRPEPSDFGAIKTHGHEVRLEPDSRLAALYGRTERTVNSYHHQGVDRVADELRVVAVAPDGVVEALEHRGDWDCLGVQWHPEKTLDGTDDVLFASFVDGVAAASAVRA